MAYSPVLNPQPVSLATNTPIIAAGTSIIGKVTTDQTTHGTTDLVAADITRVGGQTIGLTDTGIIGVGITKGGVSVNVKASSTAAVTTDSALVVAVSPNNTVTITPAVPTASIISSAATTNATSIKATAGTIYQITASNVGAAAAFIKIYNLATAPTVGTSVPALTIPVAASGIVTIPFGELGMRFGTGIALAITNLIADTDTTGIAAAQVKVITSYL